MPTAAQIKANRANAKLSTGPRTAAGKQRSSQNHLSHGFRSTHVLLPGDDPAEYEALVADLTREFLPSGLTEERYVREMADAEWRLRRVRHHEQILLTHYIEEIAAKHPELDPITVQALSLDAAIPNSSLNTIVRYGNQYQRQYDRAFQGLMQAKKRAAAAPKPQPDGKPGLAPLPRLSQPHLAITDPPAEGQRCLSRISGAIPSPLNMMPFEPNSNPIPAGTLASRDRKEAAPASPSV